MDQANRLRNIVNQKKRQAEGANRCLDARVITVTSGKGGVGKTNFAVNLAIQMRRQQKRVILIDADFGLANVEVLFGLTPQYTFSDILSGSISIEGALTTGPMGVQFLSGGSGLTALANITEQQIAVLVDNFASLDAMTDIILVDTSAGISKSVINLIKAAQETIVVTTPDPTALTDAYAVIKTARESGSDLQDFKIVVNRVENPAEGVDVFEKLQKVCSQFLGIKLVSLGNIPYDHNLIRAVKRQEAVALAFPHSDSARCIEAIARKLLDTPPPTNARSGVRSFISRLVGLIGR